MSNLEHNEHHDHNRHGHKQEHLQGEILHNARILGKEPIIEDRPMVVGHQPIIETEKVVVGQQPIYEKRDVVVGQQPIIEQRPIVVGHKPIVEQKDFIVGQQPIMGEKEVIVGQRPVIEERPAIVGERIVLEQYNEKPVFDQNLQHTHMKHDEHHMKHEGHHTIHDKNEYSVGYIREGARIALLSSKDKYLTHRNGKIKHAKERKEKEIWVVENCGRDMFAFRNEFAGTYLSCDGHKMRMSDTRGEQELWRVEQVDHEGMKRYLLSNYKGDYLSEGLLNLKLRDEPKSTKTFWDIESVL